MWLYAMGLRTESVHLEVAMFGVWRWLAGIFYSSLGGRVPAGHVRQTVLVDQPLRARVIERGGLRHRCIRAIDHGHRCWMLVALIRGGHALVVILVLGLSASLAASTSATAAEATHTARAQLNATKDAASNTK
jgi:hypothetical protein